MVILWGNHFHGLRNGLAKMYHLLSLQLISAQIVLTRVTEIYCISIISHVYLVQKIYTNLPEDY